MSGLQNARSSKRPVAKNIYINILYLWLVEIRRFCCSHVCRQSDSCVLFSILEGFLPYITIMARNKWHFVNLTFCKPDVLKPDVLKPDVLKPDVLKPDVLWVYLPDICLFVCCVVAWSPYVCWLICCVVAWSPDICWLICCVAAWSPDICWLVDSYVVL